MKILCISCIALLGIIDLFLVIAVRALEKRGEADDEHAKLATNLQQTCN